MALALGALLAVVSVLFVARPLLRPARGSEDELGAPGPEERARLAHLERRDRALAALKDLELDHRTGKISEDDYRALVAPLRLEAGEALRALEREDGREREREQADARG